ncbi:MAG: DUF1338 family protein [Planctomycetes bacterium]|nr:DUF1338 family protein [Planctomycetota bacterium]
MAMAHGDFVDPRLLQGRLFAALSTMFAGEVPLYGGALAVNEACNTAACRLLAARFPGLRTDVAPAALGAERHGAIRIGRPDEYRQIGRLFACFAMEPHGFYDMTSVGAKRQPIIATAFRSRRRPEHRMFCSLLVTDGFPADVRGRIEEVLATRDVLGDEARRLLDRHDRNGGLDTDEGAALVGECVGRIFAWTGRGGPHELYRDLVAADMRLAADIACFPSHHLNHLAFNSLAIDLFTAAMRRCLAERDDAWFRARAGEVLAGLADRADAALVRLLLPGVPAALPAGEAVPAAVVEGIAADLADRLGTEPFALHRLPHAGFKESTEGPPADVPVLLRQDSYRALTEPVSFHTLAGETVAGSHTARFGEVEQRGYACSLQGRAVYDDCLARGGDALAALGRSADELFARGQILGRYRPSAAGLAARAAGAVLPAGLDRLLAAGHVSREPLRYEDFLPVSAAGIFASNLRQVAGSAATAPAGARTRGELETILGRTIIDPVAADTETEAASIRETLERLGIASADRYDHPGRDLHAPA